MSFSEKNSLSLEEVERALSEIENRYSPMKSKISKDDLTTLSKEFDSIGLLAIDSSQSLANILKQVVDNARYLVQIHRKTLSHLKDVNIDNRYKKSKSSDLYKAIDGYKLKLAKLEDKNASMQNKIIKLTNDQAIVVKRECVLKEELDKSKNLYTSKQNQLQHQINKLTKENFRLKEMLRKDINTHTSKDDVVLKLLRQYKDNEESYKSTIRQLDENNRHLLHEILDLKEEHAKALSDCKKIGTDS